MALKRLLDIRLSTESVRIFQNQIYCSSHQYSSTQDHHEHHLLENKKLHNPGENFKAPNYVVTNNTMKLMEKHLSITGGQVRTRFPPEPNGRLHLGHARAINMNFGYANLKNGICFLRYDDTNPETGTGSSVDSIYDMIQWLGFTPYKVTYASDYFNQLYTWAFDLIDQDLAYVCHQTLEEVSNEKPLPSPWRNRPIKESIQKFKEMQEGSYGEGEAVLRLKFTTEQGKVDPVAYRIKVQPHHRTGTTWRVYPTYDYAHCLCDSIEHITHSLCTVEFELRRSIYYWICNALGVYCPVQTEYGRMNMQYTITSKRKIAQLISEGHVEGWDDPRLMTLEGLRRRGVPANVINSLAQKFGWNRRNSSVEQGLLDSLTKEYLERNVPRVMAVADPLKVAIINFPYSEPQQVKALEQVVTFAKEIYLDGSDFRESADSNYRRLTGQQTIGLKYVPYGLKLHDVIRSRDGCIDHIQVTCHLKAELGKQRAYIQWVCDPMTCTARDFNKLFHSKRPDSLEKNPNGFLADLNKDSLTEKVVYLDRSMRAVEAGQSFQFDRIGFYCVDKSTTTDNVVFNQVIGLKERPAKKASH